MNRATNDLIIKFINRNLRHLSNAAVIFFKKILTVNMALLAHWSSYSIQSFILDNIFKYQQNFLNVICSPNYSQFLFFLVCMFLEFFSSAPIFNLILPTRCFVVKYNPEFYFLLELSVPAHTLASQISLLKKAMKGGEIKSNNRHLIKLNFLFHLLLSHPSYPKLDGALTDIYLFLYHAREREWGQNILGQLNHVCPQSVLTIRNF